MCLSFHYLQYPVHRKLDSFWRVFCHAQSALFFQEKRPSHPRMQNPPKRQFLISKSLLSAIAQYPISSFQKSTVSYSKKRKIQNADSLGIYYSKNPPTGATIIVCTLLSKIYAQCSISFQKWKKRAKYNPGMCPML